MAPMPDARPPPSPYTPYSPYSAFHLPSSSSSESGGHENDDDDGEDLPFPTALSRRDFLAPTFDATSYLSSLFSPEDSSTSAQRHQTLEDLRTELRERSSAISAELLELVNTNYTSFLSLGDELKGGDDQIEDVRVALFGFRRSVADVQQRVRERRVAVGDAGRELGDVQNLIDLGRRLLELGERVAQLESRLAIAEPTNAVHGDKLDTIGVQQDELRFLDEVDEFGDPDEGASDEVVGTSVASGPKKLAALAQELVLANGLADVIGHHIPFVKKLDDRLAKCRSTLLIDLNSAIEEVQKTNKSVGTQTRLLHLLAVYRILDSEDEIVRILKKT